MIEAKHSIIELEKMNNATSLNRADWAYLQKISAEAQNSIKICPCRGVIPSNNVKFILDSKKTYSSPHPAAGLGPMYIRFRCGAQNCKTSFSPVEFLKNYHKATQTTLGKRLRTQSPHTTQELPENWNDMPLNDDLDIGHLIDGSRSDVEPVGPLSSQDILLTQDSLPIFTQSNLITNSTNDSQNILTYLTLIASKQEALVTLVSSLTSTITDLTEKNQKLSEKLIATDNALNLLKTTLNSSKFSNSLPNVGTSNVNAIPSSSNGQPAAPDVIELSWANIAAQPAAPVLRRERAFANIQQDSRRSGLMDLKKLVKPPQKRVKSADEATSAVYIAGFEFKRYREIWKALRAARFQVSRIHNIQWIGKTILEVIVSSNYRSQFTSEMEVVGFRIVNFDPSKNMKATSTESLTQSKTAFTVRCVKNILFSRSISTKRYFQELINKTCDSDQETKKIYDHELAIGLAAKENAITTIVNSLTAGKLSDEEYSDGIAELRNLDFEHILVVEFLKKRKNDQDVIMDMDNTADGETEDGSPIGQQ